MKKQGQGIFPLAPAHLVWLGAVQISIPLAFYDPDLALIPLIVFLLITFWAPFLPRFSYFLPILSRGRKDEKKVSLTFDDGPDPDVTPGLLDLLDEYNIKAAFFVSGQKAEDHGHIIKDMLRRGHSIGNHTYSHDPFIMLKSQDSLRQEVRRVQQVLSSHGIRPLAFRPPVGIVSPRLWRVLLETGMYCITFSNRPRDFGNRRIGPLAQRVLKKIKKGDIILLHDRPGKDSASTQQWFDEIRLMIEGILQRGIEIVPLRELTGRPVHVPLDKGHAGSVSVFYDSLASTYDNEQLNTGVSFIREKELELFHNRRQFLFSPDAQVLEFGAGTGLFTLEMARLCKKVTAVDVSGEMLEMLKIKAEKEGINNVICLAGDMKTLKLHEKYDLICSFSSLEYIDDVMSFLRLISSMLKPGGRLYITTAHVSLAKFFSQVGNALRQGIWLHARTRGEIIRACRASGLEVKALKGHLFPVPCAGFPLLEIVAEKP